MKRSLAVKTFRNITGAAFYIFLVSLVMQNAGRWFGEQDNMFTPVAVLLLFSLSAAVVGGLVFGQAIILFLEGKKSEGIKATFYSIGWLAMYTMVGMLILFIVR